MCLLPPPPPERLPLPPVRRSLQSAAGAAYLSSMPALLHEHEVTAKLAGSLGGQVDKVGARPPPCASAGAHSRALAHHCRGPLF